MKKVSKRCIEALRIHEAKGPLRPRAFAEFFWPGHHMHRKISNQGHGACSGKAAWLAGGGYLAKLRKRGLVRSYFNDTFSYVLTQEGKKILETQG